MSKVITRFKRAPGEHPGHYIRQWRKYRGYTQERLAEMIGASHGAISQLETGRIAYTQAMLEALADALGTEPGTLLYVDPTQTNAMWSLWERAQPALRQQLTTIAEALLKEGTNG